MILKTTTIVSSPWIVMPATFSALGMTTTIASSPQLSSIATLVAWQVFSLDKNMRIQKITTFQESVNTPKATMTVNNKPPLYHSNKTCRESLRLSTSLETKCLAHPSESMLLLVESQAFNSEKTLCNAREALKTDSRWKRPWTLKPVTFCNWSRSLSKRPRDGRNFWYAL